MKTLLRIAEAIVLLGFFAIAVPVGMVIFAFMKAMEATERKDLSWNNSAPK